VDLLSVPELATLDLLSVLELATVDLLSVLELATVDLLIFEAPESLAFLRPFFFCPS
jgi:hypothetical protein